MNIVLWFKRTIECSQLKLTRQEFWVLVVRLAVSDLSSPSWFLAEKIEIFNSGRTFYTMKIIVKFLVCKLPYMLISQDGKYSYIQIWTKFLSIRKETVGITLSLII